MHICVKKSWIDIKSIFYELWQKNLNHFVGKSFSVLEGAPFKPFRNTMTFFPLNVFIFFFNIHKKCSLYQFKIFVHKNMYLIKKKDFLTTRSSNCSVSAKFFPMLVETPYFGGVINPKTYLNHELGSKLFFPEWYKITYSFAYLVLERHVIFLSLITFFLFK